MTPFPTLKRRFTPYLGNPGVGLPIDPLAAVKS